MFERPSRDQASPSRGAVPRARLLQLAAAALANQARGDPGPPSAGRLVERWVPETLTGGAMSTRGRRIAVLAALGVVVAMVIGAVLVFSGAPVPEAPPPLPAARDLAGGGASPGEPKPSGAPVVVSVVGKVASPGLVTLPSGARVADAVRAAGGTITGPELATINLARRVVDGEQIYVGIPAPPAAPPGGTGAAPPAAGGAGGKLDLNTATAEQLDTLPGVGAVTAKRIIDWRTQHGAFTAVEQLREVDGIGQTRFERLREQVVVP